MKQIEERKRREVSHRTRENSTVSLVGYTNAGKSTLMNGLTKAGVKVEDKLFSTLDTRTRIWALRSGLRALLSDTVGFIRDLPHNLVASFHATLEEVAQADLLLHVVDAADPRAEDQITSVEEVLEELGCKEKPVLLVFNKIDRFRDSVEREILARRRPGCLCVSARTGEGFEALETQVLDFLAAQLVGLEVEIPLSEGKILADLATWALADGVRQYENERVRMKVRVPPGAAYRLEPFRVSGIPDP